MAVATAHEQCPWCGSAITRAKFVEVEARIRTEEKRRLDAAEADVRAQFDRMLRDVNEQLQRANTERAAIELKLKEATESAAAKLSDEVARIKELIKIDFDRQMLEQLEEKERLAKKAAELERELAAKTGREGLSTIDVYEELRRAFDKTGDKIVRTPKGDGGADVICQVTYNGAVCGKILVDTRPRKNWQPSYATKLRDEMVTSNADHAIIARIVRPKDQSDLCEQDGVLLAHPSLVVGVVATLRPQVIATHRAKLSTEKRAEKKTKLYEFVTSAAFRQKLGEPARIAAALAEIDVEEKTKFDAILKKRALVIKKLEHVAADLAGEIAELLEGDDS